MNQLEIFRNREFGEIRTVTVDGEPWFLGKDIAEALGYSNTRDALATHAMDEDKNTVVISDGKKRGNPNQIIINESGLYALIFGSKLESAKRFKHWVTSEVLPQIRTTGIYQKPMTPLEQITLLAQGTMELEQKVESVEQKVYSIENDMPLFGAESDEISAHVKRVGVHLLGGKHSEAYRDVTVRKKVYADIYNQLKREFGLYDDDGRNKSYKALKRKNLADAHEFIDCYTLPAYLEEQIQEYNAQMSMEGVNGM